MRCIQYGIFKLFSVYIIWDQFKYSDLVEWVCQDPIDHIQSVPKVRPKVFPKYFLCNSINLIICSYNMTVLSLKFCFVYFKINVCFHKH